MGFYTDLWAADEFSANVPKPWALNSSLAGNLQLFGSENSTPKNIESIRETITPEPESVAIWGRSAPGRKPKLMSEPSSTSSDTVKRGACAASISTLSFAERRTE